MLLNFNLRGMLFFCICLMLWHICYGDCFVVGCCALIGWLCCLWKKKVIEVQDIIFVAAFLINLWYVSGLSVDVRQYDYYNYHSHGKFFVDNDFFYKNPMKYVWGAYYHPPFWGMISGIVIKIGMSLGLNDIEAYDRLRFINLFVISGVGIIGWKFFNMFNFRRNVMLWGWGAFMFLPIHTIMAGLNNNDPMVYFLMLVCCYIGYIWYVNGGMKYALEIAGVLFLAIMTKFSGLMILVYLGMLGFVRLLEAKNKLDVKLWGEFLVIGLGGVLGFTWGFILLYFGSNLIPPPQNVDFISLKEYSLYEKLFDFSNILNVYPNIWEGGFEHNVWLALIKTSAFGEWAWNSVFWGCVLYVITIMLAMFVCYTFFGLLKYKLGKDFGLNLTIIIYTMVVMCAWSMLWRKYPYFCSVEFRYIISLVMVSFLWMMNWVNNKKIPLWGFWLLALCIVLMGVAKVIIVVSTI